LLTTSGSSSNVSSSGTSECQLFVNLLLRNDVRSLCRFNSCQFENRPSITFLFFFKNEVSSYFWTVSMLPSSRSAEKPGNKTSRTYRLVWTLFTSFASIDTQAEKIISSISQWVFMILAKLTSNLAACFFASLFRDVSK
jgi:hypothetical protein